jgi:hypothetical protein
MKSLPIPISSRVFLAPSFSNFGVSGLIFRSKVPKTYDGEKTAHSTNVAGKSGYPSAINCN